MLFIPALLRASRPAYLGSQPSATLVTLTFFYLVVCFTSGTETPSLSPSIVSYICSLNAVGTTGYPQNDYVVSPKRTSNLHHNSSARWRPFAGLLPSSLLTRTRRAVK